MSRGQLNYKVYNGKSIKKLFENSRTLMLTILFSIGIIIGALMLNKESFITDKISENINNYIINKPGQGISEIFINSLLSNGIFLALNLFLAFSLIGFPLIIWIPFLKGLGTGVISGYLYSLYGFSGFGYSILTLLPGTTVAVYALITACNISCDYSQNAYSKSIIGKGQFEKGETRYFLIKQLIYICLSVASSLIDAIFSTIFLRFFEL